MNHLKITGYLGTNEEEIIVIVKEIMKNEYMGFSRSPYSPSFQSQITFPIRIKMPSSDGADLLEKINLKFIQSESIQNGEKIRVSIDED